MCPPSVTETLDALQLMTDPLQGTLREHGPPNIDQASFVRAGHTFRQSPVGLMMRDGTVGHAKGRKKTEGA